MGSAGTRRGVAASRAGCLLRLLAGCAPALATGPGTPAGIVMLAGTVALLTENVALGADDASARGARIGAPAPALIVPQLDGRLFDLAAQRGHVVIVNFWATWCAPCRAEMPRLDSFYRRYHGRGLVVLGVSVDDAEERPGVVRAMRVLTYAGALAASARVNGFGPPLAVPVTWVIDARGVVRARLLAGTAVTGQSLAQTVLPLLPPPATRSPR